MTDKADRAAASLHATNARPTSPRSDRILYSGDLSLDRQELIVRGPKGEIDLSLGEFRIFLRLAEAAGGIVNVPELLVAYRVDPKEGRHSLEQAISRLRTKLARRGSRVTIASAYGIGWRIA